MTLAHVDAAPTVWTEDQLAEQARIALAEFVDRRLAEPGGKYRAHIAARRVAIVRLFRTLAGIDPHTPDPAAIRAVLLDEALFDALRYVAGPPVSEDDLGVLVTRRIEGIGRTDLKDNDGMAVDVLRLICRLADPYRFPWINAGRSPSQRELRAAIETTTVLQAAQAMQTERRGHGRIVERRLEVRLIELGFIKIGGQARRRDAARSASATSVLPIYPEGGRVRQPSHHPAYPHFYGECIVYGRKVDLFIALATGRMIALESKDSSSGLNSTKRLLNDTAAKARQYAAEAGRNIISVALLSGVYKLSDLKAAQDFGLYLVWAHDVDGFIEWIRTQT